MAECIGIEYPNSFEHAIVHEDANSERFDAGAFARTALKDPRWSIIFWHNEEIPLPTASSGALQQRNGQALASLLKCMRLCFPVSAEGVSGCSGGWHEHASAQLPMWSASLDKRAIIEILAQALSSRIRSWILNKWALEHSSTRKGLLGSSAPCIYFCEFQLLLNNCSMGSTSRTLNGGNGGEPVGPPAQNISTLHCTMTITFNTKKKNL